MLASNFKRTKIVATMGPAVDSQKTITELVAAGANCLRANMSHGDFVEHERRIKYARVAQKVLGKPVAVLVDLQGPRIRVGVLPNDGVLLRPGETVRFGFHASYEKSGIIPIQYDISKVVKRGETIYLANGAMQVTVKKVVDGTIVAEVTLGGTLTSKKGINLPDTDFGGDIFTVKDVADLAFAVAQAADYIGLSFVQTPGDVTAVKKRLKKLGSSAQVIAKIETKMAVKNLEEIVKVSDAVMVARGDLAMEILPEQVPIVQQHIIRLGQKHQKPIIVATQMLLSMVSSPQPTRAEVSDVATAVMQGADAVMLSEETTVGDYPIATVAMMKRIIVETQLMAPPLTGPLISEDRTKPNAIAAAAITLAEQTSAKVIIAETTTGQTARNVSSFRPSMPIIMVTHNEAVYRQMAIYWGGKSFFVNNPNKATDVVIDLLKKAGNVHKGDAIVVTSGHQPGLAGGTDTIRVQIV
ncbi:MAG: pyruvate kinase [Candidatus Saccharimonadia bacterium]